MANRYYEKACLYVYIIFLWVLWTPSDEGKVKYKIKWMCDTILELQIKLKTKIANKSFTETIRYFLNGI